MEVSNDQISSILKRLRRKVHSARQSTLDKVPALDNEFFANKAKNGITNMADKVSEVKNIASAMEDAIKNRDDSKARVLGAMLKNREKNMRQYIESTEKTIDEAVDAFNGANAAAAAATGFAKSGVSALKSTAKMAKAGASNAREAARTKSVDRMTHGVVQSAKTITKPITSQQEIESALAKALAVG